MKLSPVLIAFIAVSVTSGLCFAQSVSTTDVTPDFPYANANPYSNTNYNLQGRINEIVADPQNDLILYAADEWSGIWKSVDGGRTWFHSSTGLRNGFTQGNEEVKNVVVTSPRLAIDVRTPNQIRRLLYATSSVDGRVGPLDPCTGCGEFGGLWVSVDAGATWQHVTLCWPSQPDTITSVIFAGGQPFVATKCGLWTTNDLALRTNWKQASEPPGVSAGSALYLAAAGAPWSTPTVQNAIFACNDSTVYRSSNLGVSWDASAYIGGNCDALAAAPIFGEGVASTVVVMHDTAAGCGNGPATPGFFGNPGAGNYEVSIVNVSQQTIENLGFVNVARSGGSGKVGVWIPSSLAPTTSYVNNIFVADGYYFYHYQGGARGESRAAVPCQLGSTASWSGPMPIHADTWSMAFLPTYDGLSRCPAYAASDAGVFVNAGGYLGNAPNSCNFTNWFDASSGLHVTFAREISGIANGQLLVGRPCIKPCPILFLPTTDDDTFFNVPPTAAPNSFPLPSGTLPWASLPDNLGDAQKVLIDPAYPLVALAFGHQTYSMFSAVPFSSWPNGAAPLVPVADSPAWPFRYSVDPPNNLGDPALLSLASQTVKEVMTMPSESPMPMGDFFALESPFAANLNGCRTAPPYCSNDVIVRSANAGWPTAHSWTPYSDAFGPGEVAGIYPSGGHENPTVYVLTASPNSTTLNTSPNPAAVPWPLYQPNQVYVSSNQANFSPASGSGFDGLATVGNIFVNPYNPSEVWAIDLGNSQVAGAIKVTRNYGATWSAVPALKAIATDYGEFDFACGSTWNEGNAPTAGYLDKEIFGDDCSLNEMVFSRDFPNVRFAVLFPGGIAFSADGGNRWIALNVNDAGPAQQPIELPASAFYDPTVNSAGKSSLYVAFEGAGLWRVDAAYATLGTGKRSLPTYQSVSSQTFLIENNGNLVAATNALLPGAIIGRQVSGIQAIAANQVLALFNNGALVQERLPPSLFPQPIDGNVADFQYVDATHIAVLGTNGNLWLEEPPYGPAKRQQVDAAVGSFQALDSTTIAVLQTNGNLYLEHAPAWDMLEANSVHMKTPVERVSGSVQQVASNVQQFQVLSGNVILTLDTNGNLWLKPTSGIRVLPLVRQVAAGASGFYALNSDQVFVLDVNENLWIESLSQGLVSSKTRVDGNVASFQPIDANTVLVLGTNGNLWREQGPFRSVPPKRTLIAANVRTPSAGY